MIKLLLSYGININICNKYLQTPVHYLFSENRSLPLEIKREILEKSNNINAMDHNCDSILNLLLHNDDWTKFRNILEKKKLKIFLANKDGTTPIDAVQDLDDFYQAVYTSYTNLLKSNADWVDPVDKGGDERAEVSIAALKDQIEPWSLWFSATSQLVTQFRAIELTRRTDQSALAAVAPGDWRGS